MTEIIATIILTAFSGLYGQQYDLRNDPDAQRIFSQYSGKSQVIQARAFKAAKGKDLRGFLILMIRFRVDSGNPPKSEILSLQEGLSRLGYSTSQTGKMDAQTHKSIERFLAATVAKRTDEDVQTTKGAR